MMDALISGHGFKGTPTPDPGACGPKVCEVDFTADLVIATVAELRRRGHDAHALTLGSYADRRRVAEGAGVGLLVHVHGNVGAPGVFHFPGSSGGQKAARVIGRALGLPPVVATPSGYSRVWGVLRADPMPSVLVEAVDVRTVEGTDWIAGYALKLAAGILALDARAAA